MRVVSNTSPLLNLAIIGRLDLLEDQFGTIIVPTAVLDELRLDGESADSAALREFAQRALQAQSVGESALLHWLQDELDAGEAAAIALAHELGIETVLIDELDGRAMAQRAGLKVVGVLGILLRAKRTGRLEAVAPVIQALREQAGFYVADALLLEILKRAGEA